LELMAQEQDAIIRVEDLSNSFGDQKVHEHLSLEVRRGEILGVVGQIGADALDHRPAAP
jgi:phospholipid/cholesterol/gamma-HCH transport system ATP-binding protein